MKIHFTFLSGARAGQSDSFDLPFLQVGRHPQCELRFDADRDLDVSSRHATIQLQGEMYVLRDLGSTNGTFVHGKKVSADHVLAHGDVVQFGRQGPKVEVRIDRGDRAITATPPPTQAKRPAGGGTPRPTRDQTPRRTPAAGGGTTVRIRAEVARQTAQLRRTTLILLGLLVVLAVAYLWQGRTAAQRIARDRQALLTLVDSLSRAYQQMEVNVASLQTALDSAQVETDRLRSRIGAGGTEAQLAELRDQLAAAQRRQANLAQAASLDARAINQANRNAIVLVLAEFTDGTVRTGSGFAVRSDQASALVLTNRHVVTGPDGSRPTRLGVVFNGSNQNFRADVSSVGQEEAADVALLRVQVRGGVELVKGLVTTDPAVTTGDPVAMIGFPLGLDMEQGGDWTRIGVSASLSTGTVSKTPPGRIVVIGYGAPGSSGSPIFNGDGLVVGLVFGSQRETEGRVLLGVPIRYGLALLGG